MVRQSNAEQREQLLLLNWQTRWRETANDARWESPRACAQTLQACRGRMSNVAMRRLPRVRRPYCAMRPTDPIAAFAPPLMASGIEWMVAGAVDRRSEWCDNASLVGCRRVTPISNVARLSAALGLTYRVDRERLAAALADRHRSRATRHPRQPCGLQK